MDILQDHNQPLATAKVAVIVADKFIPEEISGYQTGFAILGAELEFVSRIWYGDYRPQSTIFYSDVDPIDSPAWATPQPLTVSRDISTVKPDDYAAVIMSANYTSVRLRWSTEPQNMNPRAFVQSSPTAAWFAEAMKKPNIVKGALCHGLWILTPFPKLLEKRTVVCNPVVMADILNCGADVILDPKVRVDGDLVTGFSKHEVVPFIQAIADGVVARRKQSKP